MSLMDRILFWLFILMIAGAIVIDFVLTPTSGRVGYSKFGGPVPASHKPLPVADSTEEK